ncbi:MAG TPA: RDD family protein [Thermoanaerobaculia bacterium]
MKENLGVSSRGHVRPSYERPFETGPAPLGTPPRARLWMRAAAFGIDLILVAGIPLLLASAIVLGVHAAALASRAPAGLAAGFRAAQAVAVCLFLLRDADGGSPGKRLFGLRLIQRGGARAGPLQSLLRNLPLLVPGWNLIEVVSLIRREDGRRPGDRAAGTALVEA